MTRGLSMKARRAHLFASFRTGARTTSAAVPLRQKQSPLGATALSYADGTPRKDIAQGRIGTKIAPGTPSAKYLYDAFAYDSPLEQRNLLADIEEVVVYGKILGAVSLSPPRRVGCTARLYVCGRKASGEKELNIVIETKDVEDKPTFAARRQSKSTVPRYSSRRLPPRVLGQIPHTAWQQGDEGDHQRGIGVKPTAKNRP